LLLVAGGFLMNCEPVCFITKNPVAFEAQRQPYRKCQCGPCQEQQKPVKFNEWPYNGLRVLNDSRTMLSGVARHSDG
jgi:hypothetical protein